jgi:hypothetical protein
VVLDDLPHVHTPESRHHLAQVLQDMVRGARCPVIMITTEESGGSMSGGFQGGGDGGANLATGSYKGLHKVGMRTPEPLLEQRMDQLEVVYCGLGLTLRQRSCCCSCVLLLRPEHYPVVTCCCCCCCRVSWQPLNQQVLEWSA